MPRVILAEQQRYEFSHTLTIRATDINYAGHLGNEALLGLVHEARAHFMKALNFDTIIGGKQRVGLIIADLAVNFKAEAFVHEKITVDCQIDELSKKSFRLFHRLHCGEKLVALVETGVVAFDYQLGRTVPLPDDFLKALQIFRNKQT